MQKFAVWPIGLGFTQGWLWVFFLNGPLLFAASAERGSHPEKIFLLFILFHSLSFLLFAVAAPRLSPLREQRLPLVAGVSIMAAGTAAAGFIPGEPASLLQVVMVIPVAAAGFGAALLVVAWGELYSALSVKQMGLSYAGAVVLGTLLFFLTSRLDFGSALTATILYPFFSLLFLLLAKPEPSPARTVGSSGTQPAFCPLPSRLVLLVLLFYLVGGFMFKLINLGSQVAVQEMYWVTNIVYCTATLLAGIAIFLYPGLDLGFLYRPVLPLLGAGFLLFPLLLHHVFAILPLAFLQAGFGLFDTYTWLLFAYLAARHRFPVRIIGWGLFLITISIFTGELSFIGVFAAIPYITTQADAISVAAAMLMLLAIAIFRENRETFAGWETRERLAPAPDGSLAPAGEAAPASGEICRTGDTSQLSPVMPAAGEPAAATTLLPNSPPLMLMIPAGSVERFLSARNLTAREKEVLLLLLSGRNNPYIREQLNISNNTLKTHLRNIYHKFGVGNRQELLSLFGQFKNNTGS
jgi:DNA-binding CsgD family transcriptional regulator